jgi:hypothetical protein
MSIFLIILLLLEQLDLIKYSICYIIHNIYSYNPIFILSRRKKGVNFIYTFSALGLEYYSSDSDNENDNNSNSDSDSDNFSLADSNYNSDASEPLMELTDEHENWLNGYMSEVNSVTHLINVAHNRSLSNEEAESLVNNMDYLNSHLRFIDMEYLFDDVNILISARFTTYIYQETLNRNAVSTENQTETDNSIVTETSIEASPIDDIL